MLLRVEVQSKYHKLSKTNSCIKSTEELLCEAFYLRLGVAIDRLCTIVNRRRKVAFHYHEKELLIEFFVTHLHYLEKLIECVHTY